MRTMMTIRTMTLRMKRTPMIELSLKHYTEASNVVHSEAMYQRNSA